MAFKQRKQIPISEVLPQRNIQQPAEQAAGMGGMMQQAAPQGRTFAGISTGGDPYLERLANIFDATVGANDSTMQKQVLDEALTYINPYNTLGREQLAQEIGSTGLGMANPRYDTAQSWLNLEQQSPGTLNDQEREWALKTLKEQAGAVNQFDPYSEIGGDNGLGEAVSTPSSKTDYDKILMQIPGAGILPRAKEFKSSFGEGRLSPKEYGRNLTGLFQTATGMPNLNFRSAGNLFNRYFG